MERFLSMSGFCFGGVDSARAWRGIRLPSLPVSDRETSHAVDINARNRTVPSNGSKPALAGSEACGFRGVSFQLNFAGRGFVFQAGNNPAAARAGMGEIFGRNILAACDLHHWRGLRNGLDFIPSLRHRGRATHSPSHCAASTFFGNPEQLAFPAAGAASI
ncbi:MAG: hypothetical protein ACREF6_11740 [Alphaproteobacteria bacterium]